MTLLFIMTVCWYFSGLALQYSAKKAGIDEYQDSGSPAFVYYGLREYRFLKRFIFSGRFLSKETPKNLRLISLVYVFLSILEFFITIFTMALISSGSIN